MPNKFKDNAIVVSGYEIIIYRLNVVLYKIGMKSIFFALQLSKAMKENKKNFYKSFKMKLNNQKYKRIYYNY